MKRAVGVVSCITPAALESAIDPLGSGAIDPEILVSAVIGLDEVPAALQAPSRFGAGENSSSSVQGG